MKKLICCFLVLLLALSAVACSGGQSKDTTDETTVTTQKAEVATTQKAEVATTQKAEPAQKVKLTFLDMFQVREQLNYVGYYFNMLDEWLLAHPNVEVDHQGVADYNVFLERRKAAFASNDIPNMLWNTGAMDIQEFVKYDYILNLKPYFDADKEWYNMFVESFFSGCKFPGDDGIYAVPFTGQIGGLYLNMKPLNDVGITKKPATMEELTVALDALAKQGKVIPFALGGKSVDGVAAVITSIITKMYGPNWVEDVYSGKAKYTDAIPVDAYKLIKQFQDKGYFGKNFMEMDVTAQRNAYYNMDAAMTQANGHIVAVTMDKSVAKDQIAYVAWPYFEKYPQFEETYLAGVGDHFSVTNVGTKEAQDLTVDFIKYITKVDNFQKNAEIQAYALMPIVKGIKVPAELPPMVKDFQDSLIKMKNSNRPATHDAFGAQAREIMLANLSNFLYGDITAEDALKNTQVAIEKALADMNK